ncbi:hypothetical protein GXW82_20775 [Streptacidiphilus sp. 4-A2]|nr:hypothetical protein [Streptacidiphilus sp. 4-A2]
MNAMKNRLGALWNQAVPLEFLPVLLATNLVHSVTERTKKAREDGERGAVSIEQALITIAVIAFAVLILGSIYAVVTKLNGQITTPPVPGTK